MCERRREIRHRTRNQLCRGNTIDATWERERRVGSECSSGHGGAHWKEEEEGACGRGDRQAEEEESSCWATSEQWSTRV